MITEKRTPPVATDGAQNSSRTEHDALHVLEYSGASSANNPVNQQNHDGAASAIVATPPDRKSVPVAWGPVAERLARLDPREYDRCRIEEAEQLGVRVTTLDAEVEWRRANHRGKPEEKRTDLCPPEPEPWSNSVDGPELLDELVAAFQLYAVLPKGAAEVLALWTVFTHTLDAFLVCPRLIISSPDAECGKTTVLTILGALVKCPLPASNITPAAVFRAIDRATLTLLIDEGDTFLADKQELRGILNSGHTRATAYVIRTVGEDHDPRRFSTWAPLAVALIGKLHGTFTSRSIPIRMFRRRSDEPIELLSVADTGAWKTFEQLKRKLVRWAKDTLDALRHAKPEIPEGLHNRTADNWRPLLAIADQAGGHWPDRARRIAELLAGEAREPALKVQLLGDIRTIFAEQGTDRITSKDLCKALSKMEDRPWGEFDRSFPITRHQLAGLLKPFGIKPGTIRIGNETPRGYIYADCEDAFTRYPLGESATPQQSNEINELEGPSPATGGDDVADK